MRHFDRATAWGLLAGLAVGLVNLAKPVHIDDALYLAIARQIVAHPFDPYGGVLNWQQVPQPTYRHSISPPLVSYYFAGWMWLCGESVPLLHAAMVPWLLLAGWGVGKLESRFGTTGGWGTLLLMLGPAVAAGTNLMLDVPLLACTVVAVELCCRGLENPARRRSLWLASGAAAAAVSIKYAGVVLLPIFALALWQHRRWSVWILVPPAAALLGWQALSRSLYGAAQVEEGLSFLAQFRFDALRMIAERTLTMFALLALTLPLWLVTGRLRGWSLALLAAAVSLLGWCTILAPWPLDVRIAFHVAVFLGAWMTFDVLAVGWRRDRVPPRAGPALLGLVWLAGFAAFAILFGPFVAVRSFLPVQVPLVLLAGSAGSPVRWRLAVVLTAVLSMGVAWADARWAGFYADAAVQIAQKYPPRRQPVYFLGHWGWQFYAERAGLIAWDARRPEPPSGAVVIVPQQADKQWLHPQAAARLILVEQIVLPAHPLGISTWHRSRGIRFYGGDYGELPWWFTPRPAEVLAVFRAR